MPLCISRSVTQVRAQRLILSLAIVCAAARPCIKLSAQTVRDSKTHTSEEAVAARRARAFVRGRTDAFTGSPLQGAIALAAARAQHLTLAAAPQAAILTTPWTPAGPVQVQTSAYGLVTGRVTAAAIDPSDASGSTVYIGTAGGGVWKSTNAAGTAASVQFKPLTDTLPAYSPSAGTSVIPSLSIGAISVQPGGTGVVLAGTGDPNDAADSYYGSGLLRSADSGLTWSLIQYAADGGGVHSFIGQGFAGIAWSSRTPQLVVAAVSSAAESDIVRDDYYPGVRGLYYSADGGVTWNLATIEDGSTVIQSQYTNFNSFRGSAATSVSWNPIRNRFYAGIRFHGYYESTDGVTWTRLITQPGAGLTTANCPSHAGDYGSVSCPIFRGAIAVQPVSGDLFALTVDINNVDQGLWQDVCSVSGSTCASSTVAWTTKLNATPMEDNGAIDQGDYNLTLAAMPAATALSVNDTLLFAGAADLYRCSLAGGCTLRNTTNTGDGCASPAGVAPAQHAIAWQANLSNSATPLLYLGSDGGLWRSTDGVHQTGSVCSVTDASHFDNLNGSLGSLAEVSSLSSHPTDANTMLAALGANGSAASTTTAQATNSSPWTQLSGGESGTVAIDQGNGNVWLAQSGAGIALHTCSNGTACAAADFAGPASVGLTQTGSDYALADPPALLDPVLNTNLLTGTCRVWRGPSSGGSAWSTANAISPFLAGPTALGCSASDASIRSLAAGGNGQITVAAQNSGSPVLYAGLSGVADGGNTYGGRIFGTTGGNYASSTTAWTDLTSSTVTNDSAGFNVGGFDVSSIAVDPNDPTGQTVYATILGFGYPHIYRSLNAGGTWANISSNLPNAPANAVAVDPNNANIVYVALDTGVYVTTNVSGCIAASGSSVNCWSVFGTSLPNAPALSLVASRGISLPGSSTPGVLRVGTYGRGIWQQALLSAGTASLPAAGFSPAALTFSAQNVGTTSASQLATLTNTGDSAMIIASVSASAGFIETDTCSGTTLAVNATCSLTVSFAPVTSGQTSGTVQVFANVSGGYAALPLNGTGVGTPSIALSPSSLVFASTPIGSTSATQIVTVANNGTAATSLSTSTTQDFAVTSTTCGTSLAVGVSCTLSISYAPTSTGPNNGLLTVADSAASHTVALYGSATGTTLITVTPSALDFYNQPVGTSGGWGVVSVANAGTASATLGAPTFTTNDYFVANSSCASALAAKSSCEIDLGFRPLSVSPPPGKLSIIAAGSTYTVSLTGTAVIFPNVTLVPNRLTFPATAINVTSASQKATLTNLDNSYLDLSNGLTQVSGDFGVTNNTCTGKSIAPNGTCAFTVVFDPSAAGARAGQLIYSTNGVSYAVTLTGTGVGTPIVSVSPTALVFPATNVNTSTIPQTVTVKNTGNTASALAAPTLTGDFALVSNTCAASIAVNSPCTISIIFTPTATGARSGVLTLIDDSGTHSIALSGSGVGLPNVSLTPSSLLFASVALHTTAAAQAISVSNTGTAGIAIALPVSTGDFSITGNNCGTTIAAGASCTLLVSFTPTLAGPRTGTLSLADASPATHTVTLSGGGVSGVLAPSANTITFIDTALNAISPVQTLTVNNTGTGTLTMGAAAVSGDFGATGGCSGVTLAPGKSCVVSLTFTPTAIGPRTGTLTLTSDSGGTPGTVSTVALSGNGKGLFYVVLTPTSINFGNEITGTISPATNVTISNTGTAAGAVQGITVSGDFRLTANTCGASLAPSTGCTVSVVFAPTAAGLRTGVLTVTDDAGIQTTALTGTGTLAATDLLTPLALTFATQQVNTSSASQSVTLTNSGDAPLTLVASQILSGDFTAVNNCGPSLAAHSSCALTVSFLPKSVGAETGVLQVSDVLHVQTVTLNGLSIAGPGVSLLPSALTFASTGVGVASGGQAMTLTNNGGVSLQLSSITVDGDFGIVAGSNGCSLTTPIPPASSCSLQLSFVPTIAGARTGTITALSNATTQTAQLSGTGIDFSLVVNGPTSLTIASGGSAVYPLLMRPVVNTANPVTYTCTGAPINAKCGVTSQYSDLSATGTVTVTILTGTTANARVIAAALLLPIFAFLPFLKRRPRVRRMISTIALTAVLLAIVSCGSGRVTAAIGTSSGSGGGGGGATTPVTPSGTYNLVVSATAAGVTHTLPLTLKVQ